MERQPLGGRSAKGLGAAVSIRAAGDRLGETRKDVDIFVPDPQYLGYLSPRLNDAVEALTSRYLESANCLKLFRDGPRAPSARGGTLRKTFAELEILEYRPTYDQCVRIVRKFLNEARR
jgi:hypothetical protein